MLNTFVTIGCALVIIASGVFIIKALREVWRIQRALDADERRKRDRSSRFCPRSYNHEHEWKLIPGDDPTLICVKCEQTDPVEAVKIARIYLSALSPIVRQPDNLKRERIGPENL